LAYPVIGSRIQTEGKQLWGALPPSGSPPVLSMWPSKRNLDEEKCSQNAQAAEKHCRA